MGKGIKMGEGMAHFKPLSNSGFPCRNLKLALKPDNVEIELTCLNNL